MPACVLAINSFDSHPFQYQEKNQYHQRSNQRHIHCNIGSSSQIKLKRHAVPPAGAFSVFVHASAV